MLAAAGLAAGLGCAGAPRPTPGPDSAPPRLFGLPESALGTQSIYRLEVGEEGEKAHLRLVLRLWTHRRYELFVSDGLGRTLWRLALLDELGFWIGERGREVCRLERDRALRWPRLDLELPADELAVLFLGRLPEPPAGGDLPPGTGPVRWVDGSGRSWELTRDRQGLAGWTLDAGATRLRWRRAEQGGRLELGSGGATIEWRLAAREPVAGDGPVLPAEAVTAEECRGEAIP